MNIFWEVHQGLPREAPGSAAAVAQAFGMMTNLPPSPRILDIGCGPGTSTVQLAQLSGGQVVAVDLHAPFLHAARSKVKQTGLSERVSTARMSMTALGFPEQTFDVVWSEGAIYIAGFENGLCSWRRLLKPGGYVAVTEAAWLKEAPPQEVRQFWDQAYPQMQTAAGNAALIHRHGYRLVGQFTLPESAWWDGYYTPMAQRIETLRQKHRDDPAALDILTAEAQEIEIYRRYSEWYGYVFYIMMLPGTSG